MIMAQASKVRSAAEEAELERLIKSQRRDNAKPIGETDLKGKAARDAVKLRRDKKREEQDRRDRRREVDFSDLDPIN